MQQAMTIQEMCQEVLRRETVGKDFVASTNGQIAMVQNPDDNRLSLVLLRDGSEQLDRFGINDTAHQQIASKLRIPVKHYYRLLNDYPDLVMQEVNRMFQDNPMRRLLRVIDGNVRAFLSDKYKPMDNGEILAGAIPAIRNGAPTTVLASHVDDDHMNIKCLFTGDDLAHVVAKANGKDRTIRPGFRLSNSETGKGSLKLEAFFYDSYCTNGCVWGMQEAFSLSKVHLGGRLIEGVEYEVVSRGTQKKEMEYTISALSDGLAQLSDPAYVQGMADKLREAAETEQCKHPIAAVQLAVKQLNLKESEQESVLSTFLRDQDFSKWGLASAVTEVANNAETTSFKRACEIENIGAKILTMGLRDWNQYVNAEKIAA